MVNNNRKEYVARINKVIDYIEDNLAKDLSLKEISEVACFTPYHFHRIFRSMVGETLNQFITRLKMEKAAILLLTDKDRAISQLMYDCGFEDCSSFARAFKKTNGNECFKMEKK